MSRVREGFWIKGEFKANLEMSLVVVVMFDAKSRERREGQGKARPGASVRRCIVCLRAAGRLEGWLGSGKSDEKKEKGS